MAAYAALVSLMNIIEQILNHPRLSAAIDKYQIESLGEKVGFFLEFIETNYNSHGGSQEAEDLESHIASAAHAAEDVIESHIVDQIHAGSTEKNLKYLLDLQKIKLDMNSIEEKVMKVKEERGFKDQQPTYSTPAASSRPLTTGKTTMVGFDDESIQLLYELTGQQSDRQVIPIVGMAGIGKTTLARNVYEHNLIVRHFDVLAWVTISQHYNVREILQEALSCLIGSTSETEEQFIGEQFYKFLSGRRYLIVLDDMWSIEAWNKIKFFFPDDHNRSRIIVTTRLSDVANHFGSLELTLKFLDDDNSWDLFCEKAFAQGGCPPELEKIGKKIVKNCKGLPLSIVVIGGLLRQSSRTQEYWENVAKDIKPTLNSGEHNQCLSILSLSYNHLPAYLKPCFLYFGIFPEDHEIRVSRLIKLWLAEGFLKPNKDQSLKEIAKGYIKDLVDRNLILVRSLGCTGRFKTCGIHDSLRDLSIRIAEKENIFCFTTVLDTLQDTDRVPRIVFHESFVEECGPKVFHIVKSTSFARSLLNERGLGVLSFKLRLLRVSSGVFCDSLKDTFEQVNLRHLAIESFLLGTSFPRTYKLPSSISLLWNLQTLIITRADSVVAPIEIWEMPQLRHIKFNLISLPDPPLNGEKDDVVLLNLQTLVKVSNFRWSEEACKRMPNIKKLHFKYRNFLSENEASSCYSSLSNIGRLNKLESLNCSFHDRGRDDLLQSLPSSLKKLTLESRALHWDDLTIIGSLPHLELLRLTWCLVKGTNWNPIEGGFRRLKYLEISWSSGLIYWNADSSHFPVLEKLVLVNLRNLNEIPSGIGEIPTLKVIETNCCSEPAAISALRILEEQESLGNEELQVRLQFLRETEVERSKQKVEQEGFTCCNFQISVFCTV